ncbi:ABC transporter ATP-binding protein [Telmatospirillum siberiense]|uniref:ABC transporter ATP-binding protein n=1 Tax=Telmatospirillum siberiense TaxID=382514 RepID=A0A2N3PPU5_9PROT|nr:ABC transporter ATP-binding protein [Telmatospirillum siberiense]PKU22425.1 ABC transporter ATP-binding protein [Telmatospirillum siberiense]
MGRLSIDRVSKVFDIDGRQVQALKEISLELEDGQFGALIGPSGCGKSTLLRMVADILPPTSGSISIDGAHPSQARKDHRIGFVFQDATLLPWRTVLENIRLPLEIVAERDPDREKLPRELIELVGLSGFEKAKPSQLSGGMQQRAAIARSLVLSPRVLLLDEPFGALDDITRSRMNLELLRIRAETKITALMVTHSIQEAVFMADRIFVLAARPGRIADVVEVGLDRPRSFAQMSDPAFTGAVDRVRQCLFDQQAMAAIDV